jgi:hypothetical protein
MDWEDIQRRARHVVPKQELKARRCWIGVLDHRKSTNDNLEESDFIWMIGHSVSYGTPAMRDVPMHQRHQFT